MGHLVYSKLKNTSAKIIYNIVVLKCEKKNVSKIEIFFVNRQDILIIKPTELSRLKIIKKFSWFRFRYHNDWRPWIFYLDPSQLK